MWVVLTILIATVAPCAADQDVIVHLRSGREVIGRLVEFDEADGVVLRRYDNGGLVNLVWDQILPEDVKAIRRSQGYVDDEPEVLFADALRLVFNDGHEVVGVLVESRPDQMVLRQKGRVVPYAKSRIRRAEEVRVEALDVYTSDELYQQHVAENAPATALEHYNAGIFCESIGRYDLAGHHYSAAQELDGEFKADEITLKIRICRQKLEAKDQTERLDLIKNLTYQKQFDRAMELAKGFEDEFGDSPLVAEALQLLRRAEEARDKYLVERVSREFLSLLDNQVDRLAIDRDLDLKGAMMMMRDQIGEAVLEKAAGRLKVDVDKIHEVWPTRKKGAFVTASYGGGSFVLGNKAYDGMVEEDETKKATAKTGPKRDNSLKGRVERIIDERKKQSRDRSKRKRTRRRGNIFDVPPTPDEWWFTAPTVERKRFLLAFFAENSKLVEVVSRRPRECVTCSGQGFIERFDRREGQVKDPCPRCKGLTFDRVVRFR